MWFRSLGQEGPRRRAWQPTPVFLPGESRGQRSLVGYSPWGRRESDLTEVTWRSTAQLGGDEDLCEVPQQKAHQLAISAHIFYVVCEVRQVSSCHTSLQGEKFHRI